MSIFYIVITLIILFIFILLIFVYKLPNRTVWKDKVKTKLKIIESKYNQSDNNVMQNLLIDADALLDYCFKQLYLKGNTMGERLKNAAKLFNKSEYNDIWSAHKIRNSILHEIDASFSTKELVLSYKIIIKAIKQITF